MAQYLSGQKKVCKWILQLPQFQKTSKFIAIEFYVYMFMFNKEHFLMHAKKECDFSMALLAKKKSVKSGAHFFLFIILQFFFQG